MPEIVTGDLTRDVSGGVPPGLSVDEARRLRRLQSLARVMDSAVSVPGTRWRVGLDPIIGLVPGIGDAAGLAVSAYGLIEARRLGIPKSLMLRMMANIGIDAAVGAIPLFGDLFDAGFKANIRNLRLIERHLDRRSAR
ncbi:DUF4112 domain-containing protein [Fodinicurvata sp. EGI_FJ10296]|uniref:DUF4112 domain-containing protein n=1 Tax=Fodinicurvata sp. EGI_FJ10296 TaxID=3231908 RepID=UPI003453642E